MFSLSRDGLGLKGCKVGSKVAHLGEGSGPLTMVLVDDTLMEFEEVEARPKEAAVSETAKEEREHLGLVSREEACLKD